MRTIIALSMLALGSVPAFATSCTEAIARCKAAGSAKPNIETKCEAAGAACMKTGTFLGPVSGSTWKNLVRR